VRSGIILIIGCLLIADVLAWCVATRWLKRYANSRALMWASHLFFALQSVYVIILVLAGPEHMQEVAAWIPVWVQAMIYIWHLVFLPAALALWLLVALAGASGYFIHKFRAQQAEAIDTTASGASDKEFSRRDMLLASVAIVPPLMTMSTTGYSQATLWQFRVSKMRLPVAGLPAGLEGFRIAHVSDLHVGRWSTRAFLDRVVDATNSLDADVVAFTGDLIDISTDDLPLAVETFKRLRAKQGALIIEGNHDLIHDPRAFRSAMANERLSFLRGSSVTLKHRRTPIEFMGIPWSRSEQQMRLDVLAVAANRNIDVFPILLAHHPHAFDAAVDAKLPLTLSGHTHAGQLALNHTINAGSMLFRYVSGIYQQGTSRLLVSNGTGNWFPLRIGAPAEIIDITLTRA